MKLELVIEKMKDDFYKLHRLDEAVSVISKENPSRMRKWLNNLMSKGDKNA